MKERILYIEDEPYLGRIVKETLEQQGYQLRWELDGARVMDAFRNFKPQICVLDIMLPNIDGYELCRQIKAEDPGVPVLFLTAKTETRDLLKGFEAGGTEYVRKPFSVEELLVRIQNQLDLRDGRKPARGADRDEIRLGSYQYYPGRYELACGNSRIQLSQRESEVLNQLTGAINQVIERKDLLRAVWGDDSFFNSRNLDVYIRKLREYLKEDPDIRIQTLKGKGYLFLVPHQPA